MRKVLHLFQKLGQLLDSNLEEPNLKFVFVGSSCQIGTAVQMLAWLVCWGWQCSPTSPCGRIRMRSTWFSQCQRWWLCSSRLMSADIWKMPLPLGVASVEPKHWEATSAYKRMSYIQPGWWLPIISWDKTQKCIQGPKRISHLPNLTFELMNVSFEIRCSLISFRSPKKRPRVFLPLLTSPLWDLVTLNCWFQHAANFWLMKGL